MDKTMIRLELDRTPISVNSAYYFKRYGRRIIKIKNAKAKQFFMHVKEKAKELKVKPFDCPVEVDLTFYFKDRRRHDVDNYQKIMNDALTKVLWNDDTQIFKLTSRKYDGCGFVKTIIEVKPYGSKVVTEGIEMEYIQTDE